MTKALSIPQLPQGLNNGLIAVAVIYGVYMLSKMYSVGDKLAEQVTEPIGQAWSDLAAWTNGYKPVEFSNAAFYLNSKYVADDGSIDPTWRAAIERGHTGIAALFATIAPKGKLLSKYNYLINGEVSAKTVK
ncbi:MULTISPECIES: hypothetical protein [unclassified Shewanella]|uniref:hypothetical protein n=1 Tax=unclassified Shewanella TaxID=196818 RepID=UPI0018E2E681|nr:MULTISPECIES: hypothetical protein [unclassified Shewanella]MBI1676952.1 hypothetical protein [Shewanella sp. DW31]MBW3530681.1 hypothetical protein [Shewanella sp. NKUCC06_TVS]GCF88772.1 hypothetical protein SMBr_10160 [Shewanella sp. M-Br]